MMNDRDWIKGFIERHTKESAGIPKIMLDAYATTPTVHCAGKGKQMKIEITRKEQMFLLSLIEDVKYGEGYEQNEDLDLADSLQIKLTTSN
jgi:hypothetical protein